MSKFDLESEKPDEIGLDIDGNMLDNVLKQKKAEAREKAKTRNKTKLEQELDNLKFINEQNQKRLTELEINNTDLQNKLSDTIVKVEPPTTVIKHQAELEHEQDMDRLVRRGVFRADVGSCTRTTFNYGDRTYNQE